MDGTDVLLAGGEVVPGDAVVLAAGPWSRRLLTAVEVAELTLWRQSMLYCAVPGRHAAAWSDTPAVVSSGRPDGAWLVPPVAGTPLKISAASACRAVADVDATATPDQWREHLVRIAAELVDGFRPDWVIGVRDCHYLGHPVAGPRLVTLGERVAGLVACGGASFKFAPLIARSLVDQVTRAAAGSLASKGGGRR